jgi:hypothetical protein
MAPFTVKFNVKNSDEFEKFIVLTHALCPENVTERRNFSLDTTGKMWLLNQLTRLDVASQVCVQDPNDDFVKDKVELTDANDLLDIKNDHNFMYPDPSVYLEKFHQISGRFSAAWWSEIQMPLSELLGRTKRCVSQLRADGINFPDMETEDFDKYHIPSALLYQDRMSAILSFGIADGQPPPFDSWKIQWMQRVEEERRQELLLVDEKVGEWYGPMMNPPGERTYHNLRNVLQLETAVHDVLPYDAIRDEEMKKCLAFHGKKLIDEKKRQEWLDDAWSYHRKDVFLEMFGNYFHVDDAVKAYMNDCKAWYGGRKSFSMNKQCREVLRNRFRHAWTEKFMGVSEPFTSSVTTDQPSEPSTVRSRPPEASTVRSRPPEAQTRTPVKKSGKETIEEKCRRMGIKCPEIFWISASGDIEKRLETGKKITKGLRNYQKHLPMVLTLPKEEPIEEVGDPPSPETVELSSSVDADAPAPEVLPETATSSIGMYTNLFSSTIFKLSTHRLAFFQYRSISGA